MRVLMFGTMWVDSTQREELLKRWIALHRRLNPDVDLLLVDGGGSNWDVERVIPPDIAYLTFPDDIGSAVKGGRDGWGRAFTTGLAVAVEGEYDYVAHVEGDSLFRLPVRPICQEMERDGVDAASARVGGMRNGPEPRWVETGLMFFRVKYLEESDLIGRYEWPTLKRYPVTSESVLFSLLRDRLKMMPWHAFRDDRHVLTPDNVALRDIDWITHCDDIAIYDRWVEAIGLLAGAAA